MLFTTHPIGVLATRVQHISQYRIITKRSMVHPQGLFSNFKDTNSAYIRRSPLEVLINQFMIKADRFKDLRSGIRHVS